MNRWTLDQMPSQEGRIAIVTGANSGIGYYTTKGLASRGAKVIMACRDTEKGEKAASEILKEHPNAQVRVMSLDLADLTSVKAFAEAFKKDYKQLDLLINNAGLMAIPFRKTLDGFEMQFGVNHLGHFALAAQLMELISATENSRIVIVSSAAHKAGRVDFNNLSGEKNYRRWSAYSRSKLANLLFMLELSDRFTQGNSGMMAVAAHPGYAASNLLEKGPQMNGRNWLVKAGHLANRIAAQSAEMGALPTLYAATSPQAVNGGYYGPGGFAEMKGYPVQVFPSNKTINKELQVQLWKYSEDQTGITFQT